MERPGLGACPRAPAPSAPAPARGPPRPAVLPGAALRDQFPQSQEPP